MMSQSNISPSTPMGATLAGDGATFRVWAPRALAVYLNGTFNDIAQWVQDTAHLMLKDGNGYWTGYVPGAKDGDPYKYFVAGAGSSGYKRDPYARELDVDPAFPHSNCLIRDAASYAWHDAGFRAPDFSDMVIYQLHIGTYAPRTPNAASTFLDVIEKIDYLVALGINVLQPLPIDETETSPSLGYDGSDYFSPDFPYVVDDPQQISCVPADDQSPGSQPRRWRRSPTREYLVPGRTTEGNDRPVPSPRHRRGCSTSSTTTPADLGEGA